MKGEAVMSQSPTAAPDLRMSTPVENCSLMAAEKCTHGLPVMVVEGVVVGCFLLLLLRRDAP